MKLTKLHIDSFRGIPDKLLLDFTDKKKSPCSTLIFGDNGSGKSSIVDALEFNLQGKIERSDSIINEFRPSPLNWKNDLYIGSKTKCYFENESEYERNIVVQYNEEKQKVVFTKSINGLHPNFHIAPIVLRRNDIITYSSTPIQRKQMLFWSFIYSTNNDTEEGNSDVVQIQNLEKERIQLKKIRRELQEILSNSLKIPLEEIPLPNNEFNSFVKNKILNGLTNKQYLILKKKGILKGVNEAALKVSQEIIQSNNSINEIQSKISRLKKIASGSNDTKKNEVQRFLSEASNHLTESFNKISTTDFVEAFNVRIGELTEVSFEIELILKNGKKTTPNNVFSEANLDLLILLLYTSIIKESEKYGQSKIFVLDDVLQSVDSTIRLNFIDYLLNNFKDWQIIITAHDRLWLNQIRSAFQRHQHKFKEIEIYRWEFDLGPQIIEPQLIGFNSALSAAIESKNVQLIASQTGLLFESICQNLSMALNTSIQRKIADKYTIGDLWPGLKKHFKNTDLFELTIEVDKVIHIRNLLGAHYNEWAISLTNSEIYGFAENVNKLFFRVYCNNCQGWISKSNTCNCKNIKLNNE
jgi:recombinational DNA repair ATPase RecF